MAVWRGMATSLPSMGLLRGHSGAKGLPHTCLSSLRSPALTEIPALLYQGLLGPLAHKQQDMHSDWVVHIHYMYIHTHIIYSIQLCFSSNTWLDQTRIGFDWTVGTEHWNSSGKTSDRVKGCECQRFRYIDSVAMSSNHLKKLFHCQKGFPTFGDW